MSEISNENLREVAAGFDIRGDFVGVEPYGGGHINDTFRVTFNQAGTQLRYTMQRINTHVFRDPDSLMENVKRVTEHARASLLSNKVGDSSRRSLTLVPTRDGKPMFWDSHGKPWRCYYFIEHCRTYDIIDSPKRAFEAAKAFAAFQLLLADMEGERLNETIPNFHNTPARFATLHEAIKADSSGRAAEARREIDFALEQEVIADRIVKLMESGDIPERTTHNDTKLNNVLIDDATGAGICVIDLDTLMPGSTLYDFGDMVRSGTLNIAEDSPDYESAICRRDIFEALASGFLDQATFMTEAERGNMAFSGRLITLEIGVRFLTDYLQGDVYFKTQHPRHNLDRCRTQFALVASIQKQQDELQAFVDNHRK